MAFLEKCGFYLHLEVTTVHTGMCSVVLYGVISLFFVTLLYSLGLKNLYRFILSHGKSWGTAVCKAVQFVDLSAWWLGETWWHDCHPHWNSHGLCWYEGGVQIRGGNGSTKIRDYVDIFHRRILYDLGQINLSMLKFIHAWNGVDDNRDIDLSLIVGKAWVKSSGTLRIVPGSR